ncbi:uncharacterized protein T551_00714 [Pneumocystis jirovecii RU7]|uniref:Dolichol phosphate-mannose biosynthesis regulatory protein n=1 Tax=Pneumocystis jirovecii (strain RU7) TaxID=1408657 RepID=A0A0W4ZUN0_PNEJ7|nr:uncharacterized protein T551_00714 [Pneumocystis jirovecii RU7]KTW32032.1 hypothetical protein T551_00714 [Pneumocystis jirovecii RU7]
MDFNNGKPNFSYQYNKKRSNVLKPFVDKDHPLHSFFFPREWAIRIPVILLLTCFVIVTSFMAIVMIKSNSLKLKKKKNQSINHIKAYHLPIS